MDEVGRGAWAGPVTVAALVPPPEHLCGVRDSKELTRDERELVAARVGDWAVAIGVGHASYEECDALGMTAALRAAGRRALSQLAALGYDPDRIILDGNYDYLALGARVTTVVRGDSTSLAVAAASCVAKVTRDALMREEAEHYPAYDFESNVGYPAPVHKSALAWFGPSAIHRRSWIFMDRLCLRGGGGGGGGGWRLFPPVRGGGSGRGPRRYVDSVGDGQWQMPTPCEGWDVRELVNHIVSGNFWAGELARGKTIEEVGDRLDGDV